ncbi:MAG: type II toxin-antitoxin system prevent-host-death family antitoxin [Clostridiales Family XIII bacterium]|jgi:prevent-host-death family protein|nr:type II toxin-antitoxin system prevent-host-death family antitoxin [Clostridiales Family XIII bacterium]
MTITVNIQEAKTQLSKLLTRAMQGDKVFIANRGVPVAKLEPIRLDKKRKLGFVKGSLPDSFFDTLPEEEFDAWSL